MQVSREEILHIADLAHINLKEDEIDNYLINLQDILNFANIVNKANVEGLDESVGALDGYNIFRKDEVIDFKEKDLLLQNAPEKERGMFKVPKVVQ